MALRLENDFLTVEIVWELGGKIAQITDRRTGRRWLDRHPRLAWQLPGAHELTAPDAYVRLGDLGGWDEVCPTIASTIYPLPPFAGRRLPDHGECWYRQPDESRYGQAVEHRWRGEVLPFELRRRCELGPNRPRIVFEYALRSQADAPLALMWSAHPVLRIEPGMRLELPAGTPMNVVSSGSPLGTPGTRFEWPVCAAFDLTAVMPNAGWAVKLFSDPLDPGTVVLAAPDGEKLRIAWSSRAASIGLRLGLWLNYGGWSGDGGAPLCNIGIEPCIGMPDALDQAVAAHTALLLLLGEERRWAVEVESLI